MQMLAGRMDCVAKLLRGAERSPDYVVQSQAQSACLAALAGKTNLSGPDRIALAGRAGQISWATAEDRSLVLEALSAAFPERHRSQMQDFEAVLNYLPTKLWSTLKGDGDLLVKVRALLDHCVALGLRHPTEPTMATLTSLLLVCHEGVEAGRSLQPGYLRDALLRVKGAFKQRVRDVAALEVFTQLPPDVAEFQRDCPRLFSRAFAEGPPLPCQAHIVDVTLVRSGIAMRRSKAGSSLVLAPPQHAATQPAAMMQTFMQQMAQMFFQQNPVAPAMRLGNGAALRLVSEAMPARAPAAPLELLAPPALLAPPPLTPASPALAPETTEAPSDEARVQTLDVTPVSTPKRKLSVDDAARAVMGALAAKAGKRAAAETSAGATSAEKKAKSASPGHKSAKGAEAKSGHKTAKVVEKHTEKKSEKKPSWSNEKSRSQIMFRTGRCGPGQTAALKYSDKKTEAAAIKKAKDMVAAELARRA